MSEVNALPAPAATKTAHDANEILRVWIINKEELAAVFPPDLYGEDIWKWGKLLANIARYAANAHAGLRGIPEAEALEAVRMNFDEELRRDAPLGVLSGKR